LAKEPLHQTEMNRVAKLDLDGLEGCDSVFAILDGLDAGTLFEIGYAASKGIPVIAFAQCVDDRDLLMIEGNPMCRVIRDFPTAIYHAAWRALEAS
jgi:nucleoside 2-deoxyribosyltransferase